MKTKITTLFLLASLFATACQSDPFQRPPLPPLLNPNPQSTLDNFQKTIPTRRTISEDTVILNAPFHPPLVALGELVIDRPNNKFDLVGLTPIGVTLFQLSNDNQTTTIHSAVPPLMQHKELLLSMAADIRHIYFHLTPTTITHTHITKTKIIFREKSPTDFWGQTTIYEFGGNPLALLEKRSENLLGTQWRIRYYNYLQKNDTLFPQAIVMDNNQFHYRIIIKNRTME